MSTYRLVKISVNPGGRYGAPDAEPGPSGLEVWFEAEAFAA
jgi:hypothetical protein